MASGARAVIPLTVITATLPERENLLHDLAQCIARQTVKAAEWIVRTDWDKQGPAKILNSIVKEVDTEWVFRCDDDDLFDPDHFATLAPHLTDDADIVYTWPRCTGGWMTETELQVMYEPHMLQYVNWIGSAAAVRTSLWRDLDGLSDIHNEDHDLWRRAFEAGATFRLIPQVTWTYRQGDWDHLSRPKGAA